MKCKCFRCSTEFKTKKEFSLHVCTAPPRENSHVLRVQRAQLIRETATSIEHLIQLIQEYCLEFGVQITFRDYPSCFDNNVSNTHNSPEGYPRSGNGEAPTGYPGWYGCWKGNIQIIDRDLLEDKLQKHFTPSEFSFSNLKETLFMYYLQTGTGTPSAQFDIGGKLFVYDFPKMHEEFKSNGNEPIILESNYIDLIKRYSAEFSRDREKYVKSSKEFQKTLSMYNEVLELSGKLKAGLEKVQRVKTDEFNKKYGKPLPLPNSAFMNPQKVKEISVDHQYQSATVLPDLEKMYKAAEKLKEEIETYAEKYPEYII